jgi:DNA-binding LytR/AlgR family response regulator
MRVLIADDEPVARQILREHLESIPSVEIAGEASTGREAVDRILGLRPDVVLLDQQMPELDGLSVVRALKGAGTPAIIFVTAFQEHALDAFEVGAVDYLLKPVRRERLIQAIAKVEKKAPPPEPPRKIAGRRGEDIYLLDPAEIIAFQAEGELVHIVTAKQRYLAEHTLKEIEKRMGSGFRRVHRSTLVNADHIRKISPLSSRRWLLTMSNGLEAVVSKRLASVLRQ